MPANLETMFYVKEEGVPWHDDGTERNHFATSREALVYSGLDWEVEKRALADAEGNLADDYGMYRVTDNSYLGTVTSGYQPWQNWEAFEFMDSLLQDGVMRYSTAGSLDGGKIVWMLAKLQEDWLVADDVHSMYLLLSTGHDGKHSVRPTPTDVRVVCQNTLAMANAGKIWQDVKEGEDITSVNLRIRHNASLKQNLESAQQALKITTAATRAMQSWLDKASVTQFSETNEKLLLDELFGDREDPDTTDNAKRERARFVPFLDAEYDRGEETVYSAFNALTGYADHGLVFREQKKESSRVWAPRDERHFKSSLISGRGVQLKKHGLAVLSELVV